VKTDPASNTQKVDAYSYQDERRKWAKWVQQAPACLSCRALAALYYNGIAANPSSIARAVDAGRLKYKGDDKLINYGLNTHNELLRFAGLPEEKIGSWKYDPHTGKKL